LVITVSGRGVHSGRHCSVAVRLREPGTGFVFQPRSLAGGGHHEAFLASPHRVRSSTLATVLGSASFQVATTEHLLSACAGLGVWNMEATVEGGELPICDGSARPWVRVLETLIRSSTRAPRTQRRSLVVESPIEVRDGDRLARLEPASGCLVHASITPRAGLASLGPTELSLALTPDAYREEIAWARTFVYAADADRLRAAGHGQGASLDNTLLITDDGVANPGGPRGESEPLRHKILDALGDLALLGAPFRGRLVLHDSGHALHVALAQKWSAALREAA